MFTGLIQTLGSITAEDGDRFLIKVKDNSSATILSDLAIGDSVAVDGVCLTVEEIIDNGFLATASAETLKRTTLGRRSQAAKLVNLETSLRVGSKLGGHFVTGHVDGIGCLVESVSTEKAWEMVFAADSKLNYWEYVSRYLVPKGSIAVNGISLTVADCDPDGNWFKVAVIPHSFSETNLAYLKIGDLVNIESDILGKYVDKLINRRLSVRSSNEEISLSFLAENGYL